MLLKNGTSGEELFRKPRATAYLLYNIVNDLFLLLVFTRRNRLSKRIHTHEILDFLDIKFYLFSRRLYILYASCRMLYTSFVDVLKSAVAA